MTIFVHRDDTMREQKVIAGIHRAVEPDFWNWNRICVDRGCGTRYEVLTEELPEEYSQHWHMQMLT